MCARARACVCVRARRTVGVVEGNKTLGAQRMPHCAKRDPPSAGTEAQRLRRCSKRTAWRARRRHLPGMMTASPIGPAGAKYVRRSCSVVSGDMPVMRSLLRTTRSAAAYQDGGAIATRSRVGVERGSGKGWEHVKITWLVLGRHWHRQKSLVCLYCPLDWIPAMNNVE